MGVARAALSKELWRGCEPIRGWPTRFSLQSPDKATAEVAGGNCSRRSLISNFNTVARASTTSTNMLATQDGNFQYLSHSHCQTTTVGRETQATGEIHETTREAPKKENGAEPNAIEQSLCAMQPLVLHTLWSSFGLVQECFAPWSPPLLDSWSVIQ